MSVCNYRPRKRALLHANLTCITLEFNIWTKISCRKQLHSHRYVCRYFRNMTRIRRDLAWISEIPRLVTAVVLTANLHSAGGTYSVIECVMIIRWRSNKSTSKIPMVVTSDYGSLRTPLYSRTALPSPPISAARPVFSNYSRFHRMPDVHLCPGNT